MKKQAFLIFILPLLFSIPAFPQLPKFLAPGRDAGYMGLWDMGGSLGFQTIKEHEIFSDKVYTEKKQFAPFVMFHLQTSLISNYFWSKKQDKRFKFGFVETVKMGTNYNTTKSTSNSPYFQLENPQSKFQFALIFEGGFGTVYKVSNKMDVGLTYYFYSISTFHDKSFPESSYAKFRFRYSHAMAEISTLGRNVIDLKYLRNGSEDRLESSYIGLTYTGWQTDNPTSATSTSSINANQLFFSIGKIF